MIMNRLSIPRVILSSIPPVPFVKDVDKRGPPRAGLGNSA